MGILGKIQDQLADALAVKVNTVTSSIMTTPWDFSDDFSVLIENPKLKDWGKSISYQFGMLSMLGDMSHSWEASVISVEVPQLSSQENDIVLGGRRFVNVRQNELFRFNIKFRDVHGSLRDFFTKVWIAQQYMYLDDIATIITIKAHDAVLFKASKCLISQISAQTFDHNNTGLSEFDVTFVCPDFSNYSVKDFGIDSEYSNSFLF